MNKQLLTQYTLGFLSSIILTLLPLCFIKLHENSHHALFSHDSLLWWAITFAIAQLTVQVIFFLHLKSESGPKWNTIAFGLTIFIVLIVVGGSLWIMQNLDHNMTHMPVEDEVPNYHSGKHQ